MQELPNIEIKSAAELPLTHHSSLAVIVEAYKCARIELSAGPLIVIRDSFDRRILSSSFQSHLDLDAAYLILDRFFGESPSVAVAASTCCARYTGLPTLRNRMNILLYSPDNGVTRNFMPHLWMFLLKSLTPPGHQVFLLDGNAQPMTEHEISEFVRKNDIRLVGISAMTRMAVRAYKMADAIRAAGAKVVFGGPHEAFQNPLPFRRGPASPHQETA